MKVNPKVLGTGQPPANNTVQRNSSSTIGAFIKSSISSALEGIFSKPLNVRLESEKELNNALSQLVSGIQEFNRQKKDLQIGKASLTTQKIDAFEVSNLENLTLQNVEKLSFAFEQLKPIIAALQSGNKLDQQSVAYLRTMTNALGDMHTTLRGLQAKEMVFPVEQIVSALGSVETSIKNLKLETPAQSIKIPEFPKSVSMTEGKAILKALQNLSDKIDELPRNFPELTIPKTVSIDNFPPQKYPMPVTNININPLRGFAKTRNVTVGATTPLPLPGEVLAYRRSLVVYNNSSTITLYVGGSDVNATNGMPVPPLSWSPAFDAGPRMIVYGIAASSTVDVRTLELSSDNIGG